MTSIWRRVYRCGSFSSSVLGLHNMNVYVRIYAQLVGTDGRSREYSLVNIRQCIDLPCGTISPRQGPSMPIEVLVAMVTRRITHQTQASLIFNHRHLCFAQFRCSTPLCNVRLLHSLRYDRGHIILSLEPPPSFCGV